MLDLWKDFLRVYGLLRRDGRNIFYRTSRRTFNAVPFDTDNVQAGLVLSDALEERCGRDLSEQLDWFIRSIDAEGHPENWKDFRDVYEMISGELGEVQSGGYEA